MYCIITEAPGCFGDVAHVRRIIPAGGRVNTGSRTSGHLIPGDPSDEYAYRRGDRLPGWRAVPDYPPMTRGEIVPQEAS